jgi:prophage DNA circulation protein
MDQRRPGRRTAEHDYPYRDTVWIEDTGLKPRRFTLQGFLVSNSLVYGGGDVLDQVAALEAALETPGPGLLVHPTKGPLLVNLVDSVITSRWDGGESFEFELTFLQGGAQIFPSVLAALGGLIDAATGGLAGAALSSFTSVITTVQGAVGQAAALASTARSWVGQVQSLAGDATSLYNTVSQLGGADYGRYFNGANAGYLQGLSSPYAGANDIDDLLAIGQAQRQAVIVAGQALTAAVSTLGNTTTATDVGNAAQALVTALQACPADPADGVRILTGLAVWDPGTTASGSTSGAALSAILRRAALAAAATVGETYAPASAQDANAVRLQILAPIDAEIAIAGAAFDDASFSALRDLRTAVYTDLAQRGAALPQTIAITTPVPEPAMVLAQRLYQDASRRDELVTEANPINPLFMPIAFQGLAA